MAIGTSQAFRTQNFRLLGNFYDKDNWVGKKGYALSSDEDGVHWEADQNETSGIFSGGIMTATIGGTTFNVSAGVGQVVSRTLDIPTGEVKTNTTRVSWNAQSNIALTYRTTHPFSYIYIDENGAIQQQNSSFTDAEYKNKIILGTICHIDLATINLVTNKQNITYGDSHRLYELISTFGPIKRSGLAVSAYTTNLRLKRESGVAFLIGSNYTTDQFEPDSISLNSANPASLCRVYKNGTGGFVFDTNGGSFYTDVDPNKYDNGSGTLQTVNNNQWTIQRLFFFPNNPNDIIAYYGVGIYNSYGDAVTAMATESFSEATITAENAVFLAYLVVRGGATDLSLVSDGKFFQSGAFRNIGAIGGGGGGAGAIILDDLTDVAITTPLEAQFLAYDGGTSLWKNSTLNVVNPLVFSGIGTSLTLSLNYATASQPGGVSTSAQTFGGVKTFASNVIVSGNLTVNGTTTTIDAQTLVVKDKNIELGVVASPTDLTADGGGITLKGATDKTFNWIDATDSWTSSEYLDLASGKAYKINGTNVLTSTTLGSGVINSSLQSVGTLNNLTVAGYAYLATTSGSVGVGTTIASGLYEKLAVAGGISIKDNVNGKLEIGRYNNSTATNSYIKLGANSDSLRITNNTDAADIFTIKNDGIVGIGTVNPSNSKLHIYADHISGHSVLKIQTITAIAGGGVPSLGFFDSDGSRNTLLYAASDGTYLANEVAKPIFFSTNSTIKMTVTSTGNVGIGTTTPNQFLEVRRTTGSAIALLNYNDTVKLNINASSGGAGYVGMVSNHPLILVTNDTEKVKIGTNGNVCIGNADANNKLSVLGSASVGSNYNVAAPTNGLLIEGSVGIGLTNPSYKLDISSSLTGTTVGSNVVLNIESQASGRDVEIRLGDTVNSSKRLGYLSGNFYIASGTTENFRIDLNGNVGVNTTNPATRLEIADLNVITDSIGNLFVRTTNNQGINIGGQISLGGYYSASNIYTFGSIAGRKENATSGNVAGYLALSTTTSGGTNTERVRVNSDGNVGINVTSPLVRLHTVGQVFIDNYTSLTAKNILTLNMNGANYAHIYDTGLAGNVIAIGGASTISTVPSSSIMSWDLDDAKVGIGTNTPNAKLDVNGGAIFANGLTVSTDASSTSYFIGANGTRPIIFQNNTGASYDFGFKFTDSNTFTLVGGNTLANPTTDLVSFKFDGNVGIGTTAPTGGLHINNAQGTFSEVLRLQRNGGIFYSVGLDTNFLNIAYNGNTNASNIFVLKTNGFLGLGNLQTANYNLDIASTQGQGIQLRFDTTTNYLARITPYWNSNTDSRIDFAINRSSGATPDVIMSVGYGGNVGIGTTAPSKTLDVKGAGGVLNLQSTSNDVWQTFTPQTGNVWRLQAQTGNTFGIYDEAASAFRLLINSNGNVGIGSASANNKLYVSGSASIGSNYNIAAPTNGLIVEGNVGIGTSTVSTKLHVSGGTYISNIVGTGDLRIENTDTVGVGISLKNHTGKYWFMYNGGSSSWAGDGVLGFVYTDGVNAATGPKVVFKSDGNVGIGTINPAYKLEVASGTSGQQSLVNFRTADSTTANNAGIQIFATPSATATSREAVMALDADGANASGGDYFLIKKRGNSGTTDFEQYSNASMRFGTNFISRATYDMTIANDGNVGIGTTNPISKLDVRGQTYINNGLGTGSGQALIVAGSGDVQLSDGGSLFFGAYSYGSSTYIRGYDDLDIMYFYSNGTNIMNVRSTGVGIGTANPNTKIHILAADATTADLARFQQTNQGNLLIQSQQGGQNLGGSNGILFSNAVGRIGFRTNASNGDAQVVIDANGNLGVGTVAPSYKLHVVASSAIVSNNILRLDGGNTGFNGANDADTAFSIMFDACAYKLSTSVVQRNGAEIQMLKFGSWNEAAGGVGTKGSLVFKTNNGTIDSPDLSERMRIQYNGNVGIGNSSPVAKLDIRQTSASTALKVFTNDTSTAYIAQFIGYDNTLGDTTRMVVQAGGNVGIGTTAPSQKLEVVGGEIKAGRVDTGSEGGQVSFGRSTDNNTAWYIDVYGSTSTPTLRFIDVSTASVRMVINESGNVGIGVTSPTNLLDVSGTARIRSISASASVATIFLTTDANGVLVSRTAAQVKTDIGATGTINSVTATAPIASSGGVNPNISLNDAGVTYAKIQNVAVSSVLGNSSASVAQAPQELSMSTLAGMLSNSTMNINGTATNATNVAITTDDSTNSSYYLYFGANASGNTPLKASTKIRYNPSTGAFSATTKSFRIPHPTKPEHDLVYGSLESPYHGIRLTGKGKTNGTCAEIILPDYVNTLVDENTVNIQITAYKCAKVFYVENVNIKDNKFVVKYDKSWYQKAKDVEFFWDFTAERKDVPKLIVEEKL